MKALITGGAGFIGSHLCQRMLEDGHEIVSLDNFDDFYDPAVKRRNIEAIQRSRNAKFFQSVEGDIRDGDKVFDLLRSQKPSLIVHLAAKAGVRPSIENPLLYSDVNVRGTEVILDAAAKCGVKKFIFGSSSSVYGNNQKAPFSEIDPVDNPISPYAGTKKAGELTAHIYSHLHGMSVCCLRFFTVYGPRQRPDLAIHKFSRLMTEGKEIPFFGDGTTKRDYTYIDDVLDGILKAVRWLEEGASPRYGVFNIGENRTISLKELVETLEKTLGLKAKIQKLPAQPGDVVLTYADISKSKQVLGYSPATNFEAGIAKFVTWFNNS